MVFPASTGMLAASVENSGVSLTSILPRHTPLTAHRMAFAPLGAAQSWADALQKQLRAGRKKEVAVDFRARNLSIDAAAGWLMDFYERIE